ncbi:hypothetical protein BGX30_014771 [Mortierella sp. GBA39]|nr:hypothetical protein BGX30_014771 [Mortierella sp. GBA39]
MNAEKKPTVMIVGAGLGGLLLGTLLHKAGSSIPIGGQIVPLFAQLGLDKDLLNIAKPLEELRVYNEKRELNYTLAFSDYEHLTGHKEYMVARPALYDLLIRQIPPERIHRSKRMLTKLEADDGIIIKMSDGSTYKGDILVGADGACSTVRQRLFDRLKNEGKLCKGDREHLPFRTVCLVGQTRALDPMEFPQLQNSLCEFCAVLGDKRIYTVMISTTSQNTVTWTLIRHLDKTSSADLENQRLKNTENTGWGPLSVQAMCDETRGIGIPGGNGAMNLGDLMDLTPKELMSKVMLEEKVFETWYSGRTVLLGDAARKINPAGGRAAKLAMHDAVALANLIYTLPSSPLSIEDTTTLFSTYWTERYPAALEELQSSQLLNKTSERGLSGTVARFVARTTPSRIWRQVFGVHSRIQVRPIVAYLPAPDVEGTEGKEGRGAGAGVVEGAVEGVVQSSYLKAKEVFERRKWANKEP